MLRPGDRVLYLPPLDSGRRPRFGHLQCVSGPSALILFDDYPWPQWTPLGRLYRVTTSAEGWLQIDLLSQEICHV